MSKYRQNYRVQFDINIIENYAKYHVLKIGQFIFSFNWLDNNWLFNWLFIRYKKKCAFTVCTTCTYQ